MTTQPLIIAAPRRIPVARLLRAIQKDPLMLLADLADTTTDVAHIRIANSDLFLLTSPDVAREALVTQHRSFIKGRPLQRARRVLGDGLLTSEGDLHLRQRRMIQPAFHRARVAAYGTMMAAYARRHIDQWQPDATLEVTEQMAILTMAIAGKALFDADVTADAQLVGTALSNIMASFHLMMHPFGDLLLRLPLPATLRLRQAEQQLDSVIERLIAERLSTGDHGDILSMLLFSADEQGQFMDAATIRDQALTLFLAGHETTANSLSWTWYLLARNPTVEAQMHAEIDALGGQLPTAADMARLPYTRAVLAESMRLYPPAWAIGRSAIQDTTIAGRHIPNGATVIVSPWLMHRDERLFPDAGSFNPSRWLTESPQHPKHAYMPFGAGPRMCIGESFAWMEGVLLLATIAQRWQLRLMPGYLATPQPSVTLRIRGGLPMVAEPRALNDAINTHISTH